MSAIKDSQVFVSRELRRNAHLSIIKRFLNRQALGQGENWEAGSMIITSVCLSQVVISSEAAIRTLHPTHVFLPATLFHMLSYHIPSVTMFSASLSLP